MNGDEISLGHEFLEVDRLHSICLDLGRVYIRIVRDWLFHTEATEHPNYCPGNATEADGPEYVVAKFTPHVVRFQIPPSPANQQVFCAKLVAERDEPPDCRLRHGVIDAAGRRKEQD